MNVIASWANVILAAALAVGLGIIASGATEKLARIFDREQGE